MMKNWKRIAAFVLTVCLLLSALPPVSGSAEQTGTPSPVLVHSEPVTVLEGCLYGTTAQVNGSNYLFEPIEGGELVAFDLSNNVRKYEVKVPHVVVRGITTDSNNKLWMGGDNTKLYYFDPITRTGETLESFKSVVSGAESIFGMAYDKDHNNLYFGVYPTGSIVSYDIDTKEYKLLYEHNDANYVDGIVYRDGYVYAGLYGDKNNDKTKTSVAVKVKWNGGIVGEPLDISSYMPNGGGKVYGAGFAGDLLLMGGEKYQAEFIAIDISNGQFKKAELTNVPGGILYGITEEVDGKVYFVCTQSNDGVANEGLIQWDVADKSWRVVNNTVQRGVRCGNHSIMKFAGESKLVTYAQINGCPMICTLDRGTTPDLSGLTVGCSSTTDIRTLTKGANGDLYIGAYNTGNCATYNTNTGELTPFATDGQTDAMCYYNGKLYAGTYNKGNIVEVDLENNTKTPLLSLTATDSVDASGKKFDQTRIHTLTGGLGMNSNPTIFAGSVPNSYAHGGCIAWVDLETKETYVDWLRDENGKRIMHSVNCLVYHDGYLYGTTSLYGGNAVDKEGLDAKESALLFIYDVAQNKTIKTFDLRNYGLGLTGTIDFISGIAADPNVAENGRFWGLVAETLFSFTFNGTNISVTKHLSYSTTNYSAGGGRAWAPRPFCFDKNNNLYLSFGRNGGFRRININNTSDNVQLPLADMMDYALGADGNLYYLGNGALYMYPLSVEDTDWTAAAAVDTQILATDAAKATEARNAYNALSLTQKALVQELEHLEDMEVDLLELQIDALPDQITSDEAAKLEGYWNTYVSMTDRQKENVQNYLTLASALNAVDTYEPQMTYQVGETIFESLDNALAAAADAGETVKLLKDATVDTVVLPMDVTLDLNGHTLTATVFVGVVGNVVDSSEGNVGLLKVKPDDKSFNSENTDAPLYDKENGGYRFFTYKLDVYESTDNVAPGREKFWFKFHFYTDDTYTTLDQNAYDLVKAGGSGMQISANLTWQETGKDRQELNPVVFCENGKADAFSQKWATGAHTNRWLYVTVSGLDQVNDGTLTVTPVIDLNDVKVTNGSVTYVKNSAPAPDYGWDPVGPSQYQ